MLTIVLIVSIASWSSLLLFVSRNLRDPRRRWFFTLLFACCGTILLARCKRKNPNSSVRLTLCLDCRTYRPAAAKSTALSGMLVATGTHERFKRRDSPSWLRYVVISRERFDFSIEKTCNSLNRTGNVSLGHLISDILIFIKTSLLNLIHNFCAGKCNTCIF